MGRPNMVQTMESLYTYTEMQDTNVTHFGLWDGNIDYRGHLVDAYGLKTKIHNWLCSPFSIFQRSGFLYF